MPFFFCKLVPPRPTFSQDMTTPEREAMLQHVAFWQAAIERGVRIFALGPVQEPATVYGIIVVEMEHESAVRKLAAEDPAVRAGLRYEIHPMPRGVMHNDEPARALRLRIRRCALTFNPTADLSVTRWIPH